MVITRGEEIVCLAGHICGEVLQDLNSDQRIVMPAIKIGSGGVAFSIDQSAAAPTADDYEGRSGRELVARRSDGSGWKIHTKQGWIPSCT